MFTASDVIVVHVVYQVVDPAVTRITSRDSWRRKGNKILLFIKIVVIHTLRVDYLLMSFTRKIIVGVKD